LLAVAGTERACGWCKDPLGLSWQITPRLLLDLPTSSPPGKAKRAFEAMMAMTKIDIAALARLDECAYSLLCKGGATPLAWMHRPFKMGSSSCAGP
jgi:hypothetical protein